MQFLDLNKDDQCKSRTKKITAAHEKGATVISKIAILSVNFSDN
jgi:hypothetical protein